MNEKLPVIYKIGAGLAAALMAGTVVFAAYASIKTKPAAEPPQPAQSEAAQPPAQAEEQPAQPIALPEGVTEEQRETYEEARAILIKLQTAMALQEETDALIEAELQTGAYSFENPLVVENPYGISPLTAIVAFETPQPEKIHIRVAGKTAAADIEHEFAQARTRHILPVYGLYPNMENTVVLSSGENREKTSELKISTDSIAGYYDKTTYHAYAPKPEQMQPGLNFLYEHKIALDVNGDIRWMYTDDDTRYPTLYNYNGNTVVSGMGSVLPADVFLTEQNLLGRYIRIMQSPYGLHHDITQTDTGNLLVTGSQDDVVEDFIYEMDPETGEIVNTLNLKNVLPRPYVRVKTPEFVTTGYEDWFHNNTIVWDRGDVILSGRNISAVVKTSWPEGELKWVLASPEGWPPFYDDYLLTPVGGGDFEWPFTQHTPILMPDYDQNPDTVDLMIFDNGAARYDLDPEMQRKIRANEIPTPEPYSRMVHYRINEKEKTIQQVWQYGKERGRELYSYRKGSVQGLENNNRLGLFTIRTDLNEDSANYSVISEVNDQGELVWELWINAWNNNFHEYRAKRTPAYAESDLDIMVGVPTKNLIPAEIWQHYGLQPEVEQPQTTPEQSAPEQSAEQSTADSSIAQAGTASASAAVSVSAPSAAASAPAATGETKGDNGIWSIEVLAARLEQELSTTEKTTLYGGETQETLNQTKPQEGNLLLLVELEIQKLTKEKAQFLWDDVYIEDESGNKYSRHKDDTFLQAHGMKRIKSSAITFGKNSGYACFEVAEQAKEGKLYLVYSPQGEQAVKLLVQ